MTKRTRFAIALTLIVVGARGGAVALEARSQKELRLPKQATMRVDYYHTGNDKEERFSLDRIVIEPLAVAGQRGEADR